jgi:hypothetical protein
MIGAFDAVHDKERRQAGYYREPRPCRDTSYRMLKAKTRILPEAATIIHAPPGDALR